MATKVISKSASGKKETKVESKSDKKSSKAAAPKASAPEEVSAEGAAPIDPDELEEAEESTTASSAGGNAAAMAAAAANGQTDMSASFKNFRHHPDMENFYRFIYENDLRHEALAIIDQIMAEKQKRRALRGAKATPH